MISKNTYALWREGRQRIARFYHTNADLRTLPNRLKYRQLRRDFYGPLWQSAAENIGAKCEAWVGEYKKIYRDDAFVPVYLTQVNLNSALMDKILIDKLMTQELLQRRHYPIPKNIFFKVNDLRPAQRFLDQHRTVVVKPAGGTAGGCGVTTDIRDMSTLERAAKFAARYAPQLILEEHVTGDSYRLLYVGGKFIDAVRRTSPLLTGDGHHTIRQLISMENGRRLTQKPISSLIALKIDEDCRLTLKKNGYSVQSVPDKGAEIMIKQSVNENNAAQNFNAYEKVHPATIAMGESIMRDFNLELGGIDIQCSDISIPLEQSGGRILEINSPPGIHHHYLIDRPNSGQPVAEHILEYMFKSRTGTILQS